MNRTVRILDTIETMYPDAKTELNFNNLYELCIAVILSAQSTDLSVNKVTPDLFSTYPDVHHLAKAKLSDVEYLLKTIGLYRSKAKNIIEFSNQVIHNFNGEIPDNIDDLIQLAGVGRKTANVVVSEHFNIPAIAVDTHVERVSKRLKIVYERYNVLETEKRLMRAIPKDRWRQAHHSFILFGRYTCKAIKPDCQSCPLQDECKYYTKHYK
ncbi:MAG: endonuclease III [Erysipelothrix sp.]|nr:endonuclease III [Erysipelothrix sp.]